MKFELPRVIKEINRLNWIELEDQSLDELTQNLEDILIPMGFNLSTKLKDVMAAGNDRTYDYDKHLQSNWLDRYMHAFLEELENAGDPEILIKDEIELIECEFAKLIIDEVADKTNILYKPIVKWDKKAVAFYCHQQKPNTMLSDLLYFIFVFEHGEEKTVEEDLLKDILHDFSIGIGKSMYLQELKHKLRGYSELHLDHKSNNIKESTLQKLKWLGSPSQFGFIIQELIEKGYLERPTASFARDAQFYLSLFDLDTTPGSLAKEINENSASLTHSNAVLFKIPHKDKLI